MNATATHGDIDTILRQADDLRRLGQYRPAIDLLTQANRGRLEPAFEVALLSLRREAGAAAISTVARAQIAPEPHDGSICEIEASRLSAAALRSGIARSGCLLVRGMVGPERVAHLKRGIDSALATCDAAAAGSASIDPGWFTPCSMPDRTSEGLPEKARRRFNREAGSLVTADSPRMLFEVLELVDYLGVGALMTEYLGERPLLSANKCTLRRIEPTTVTGGWHQDGAFLGDEVGSFNFWLALSDCGVDAPGMDIVPRRLDGVLASDDEAQFDWSLSDRAVREAAGEVPIVRPAFRAGDALLFDHRLVHRTAAASEMTQQRYAIESWFFAPSAYPVGQLPLLY